MIQIDDSLSMRITCGVEGSHMTTKDVEGEVWKTSLPQPTIPPFVDQNVG
jgi:hypothetical protein